MKKLLYILLHRSVFVTLALLAQIAALAVMVVSFSATEVFYWCCIALSVAAAVAIVGSRMDPGYKIAWLLLILPFPIFGGVFYLMVGGGYVPERTRKRMKGMLEKSFFTLKEDFKSDDLLPLGGDAAGQASYLERRAACPAYTNTETEYFPLGDEAFPRMLEELEKAEKYIFLEYFIIQPGVFWDSILSILERKAAQGVEVRVLYDDFGCMFTLPRDYNETLIQKGIQCRVFNRLMPVMSLRLNNRDHRKLLIIDGRTGFTGGINLADEYINAVERCGHWKDTGIRLTGTAAWSFTVMFLSFWSLEHDLDDDVSPYVSAGTDSENIGFVQPFADKAGQNLQLTENVLLQIINSAKDYVYINTPYLILDNELTSMLCLAAKSGVDVRITVPHIPDKRMVVMMTRSFYARLIEAGVKIYEYTPGFVHAKSMVSDNKVAYVGTCNLDYRSLYLHFECGAVLYECPCIRDIRDDYLATVALSEEITYKKARGANIFVRLARSVLRIFAPLL